MRVTHIFAAAALALVSTFSLADTGAEQAIRKSLETLQLDVPVESISASPLPGMYEVKLKGSRGLAAIVFAVPLHAVSAHAAITIRAVTRLLFHDELLVVRSLHSDRRVAYRQ